MVLGKCSYCRLGSLAYCSGRLILGSLCSVWILESVPCCTVALEFSHAVLGRLIPGSVHATVQGSLEVYTYRSLGNFTYHRGRLQNSDWGPKCERLNPVF